MTAATQKPLAKVSPILVLESEFRPKFEASVNSMREATELRSHQVQLKPHSVTVVPGVHSVNNA